MSVDRSTLLLTIDKIALRCCKRIGYVASKEIVKSQMIDKRLVRLRKVGRGVYEVDGHQFLRLWSLTMAYVTKSVMASYMRFSFNYQQHEDDIADIRAKMYYVLMFFGPKPNGKPFSDCIKYIVSSVLSSSYKCRRRESSSRGVFPEDVFAEDSLPIFADPEDNSLFCHFLDSGNRSYTARIFGVNRRKISKLISVVREDFSQV